MFSFFQPAEKTRLDKCKDLDQFRVDYAALIAKKQSLEKAGDSEGKSSIAWRKAFVLSRLTMELDSHIDAFNLMSPPYNSDNLKTDMIQLMKALSATIIKTRGDYDTTIMTQRSNIKERASKYVDNGVTASGVANIAFGPLGLLASTAILLFGHHATSSTIKEMAGLNDKVPATVRILNRLTRTIDRTGWNLGLEMNWSKSGEYNITKDDYPSEFICPITGTLMNDPVICTLDDTTYEREAIIKWLTERRNSPMNRKEVRANAPIESVLISNKALREMIEAMTDRNPVVADQKFS